MQIFASDPDPIVCARNLDNARVIKMIVETAQLLSTAVRKINNEYGDIHNLYLAVPQGKALSNWATGPVNMHWLITHGLALSDELDRRGLSVGKFVRTREVLHLCKQFCERFNPQPHWAPSMFINATEQKRDGVNFKHILDTHQAYKMYLTQRWEIQQRDARVHLRPRWSFPAAKPDWAQFN